MIQKLGWFIAGVGIGAITTAMLLPVRPAREQGLVDALGPSEWSRVLTALETRPFNKRGITAQNPSATLLGPTGTAGGDWTPEDGRR